MGELFRVIIETKFDVGDEVWTWVQNNDPDNPLRLTYLTIKNIDISIVNPPDSETSSTSGR